MQPKHELLVFSKKEILVVMLLLILVALFSFTLGLRLGKALAGKSNAITTHEAESPPMLEGAMPETVDQEDDAEEPAPDPTPLPGQSSSISSKTMGAPNPKGNSAENLAEQRLLEEAKKEGVKSTHLVAPILPGQKKRSDITFVGFTLQIGAYKTVAEAPEQVTSVKRKGLDQSFYFETEVPGKGTWYRVGIGVYKLRIEAERAGVLLKKNKQVPDFIVQRVGE